MILSRGQILPNKEQESIIKNLPYFLLDTLKKSNPITIEKVIQACDTIAQKVLKGDYNDFLKPLLAQLDYSV